ncbi:minor tail protein [Shewanella phage S0112]|nr:minor tail protein [Shewanella phage S0112]
MAYGDIEISEDSGEPIELFVFERPQQVFRYTNHDTDINFLGNTFGSIPIKRSRVEATTDLGKSGVTIEMVRNATFAQLFIANIPAETFNVTIYRTHLSSVEDSIILWQGRVVNAKLLESTAEIYCQPLYTSIKRPGLRRAYQINCPHVLYGPSCKVVRDSLAITTTNTTIAGNTITSPDLVETDALLGPTWYTGGYVEITSGGAVDRRFITNYDNLSGSVTLNLPFKALANNSEITVYPGCDRVVTTCSLKFNNLDNFGGFPYIPQKNPMDGTPIF